MGTIYLLHFSRKYHHAGHYIGFVRGNTRAAVEDRLERHRSGDGARLLAVITQAGITFECVRIWENVSRDFERKLKKRKCANRMCPICASKGGK